MTWIVLVGIFGVMSMAAFTRMLSIRQCVGMTLLMLVLFGFWYQPSTYGDIYRYLESFEYMKTYGATAAYDRLWYVYEGSMLFYYMMVAMSRLPTMFFVPLCILATYGVAMLMFYDAAKRGKLTKDEFSILFIFFVCCVNFAMLFSVLRFYLAHIWGFAGIYLWFREKGSPIHKLAAAGLMVSAVFLHSSGFMIPVIWVLVLLYRFKTVRVLSLMIPFVLIFIDNIISLMNRVFGGISLYRLIVNKYYSYAGKSYLGSVFTRTNLFYFQLLVFILLFGLTVMLPQKEAEERDSADHFYLVMLLLTVAYVANEALFLRYIQLLVVLTPIYLALNKEMYLRRGVLQSGMLAESVIMLMFYGRLSTYYYI